MIYPEDEFDWSKDYQLERKFMSHNIKMFLGLAIVFVIGGLQALKGVGGYGSWIETIIPALLFAEHYLDGNK